METATIQKKTENVRYFIEEKNCITQYINYLSFSCLGYGYSQNKIVSYLQLHLRLFFKIFLRLTSMFLSKIYYKTVTKAKEEKSRVTLFAPQDV